MPTYQYRCPQCGHEFEAFQYITEDAIKECPACHGETRRVITGGSGFLFKGSGFYITDYRSESYKKAAASEKSSSSGGSEKKSDSTTKKSPDSKTSGSKGE